MNCGDGAAYVLGALEPDEADEFRRHIDRCATCGAEVAGMAPVADALLIAVPQYRPPAGLRRRVLRTVRAESRRKQPARRRAPALAGALALALVGLVIALALHGSSAGVKVLHARVLDSAATADVRLTGGHAELIVRHLPAPSEGRIYEVWLERPGARPAPTTALFSVTASGAADVGVPGPLTGTSEIVVTQEPAGGSRVPTSEPVIVAPTG
jgi:anti-sigma-K factor RskA